MPLDVGDLQNHKCPLLIVGVWFFCTFFFSPPSHIVDFHKTFFQSVFFPQAKSESEERHKILGLQPNPPHHRRDSPSSHFSKNNTANPSSFFPLLLTLPTSGGGLCPRQLPSSGPSHSPLPPPPLALRLASGIRYC